MLQGPQFRLPIRSAATRSHPPPLSRTRRKRGSYRCHPAGHALIGDRAVKRLRIFLCIEMIFSTADWSDLSSCQCAARVWGAPRRSHDNVFRSDWRSLAAGRSPEWDWRAFSCIRFAALGKGFQFGQNGGEKFRNRRMNMHCALYNRIRRLRIHGVQQNLDYFIASDAKDRST